MINYCQPETAFILTSEEATSFFFVWIKRCLDKFILILASFTFYCSMKRKRIFFLDCIVFYSTLEGMAQQALFLSNYTFSENNTLIGTISGRDPGSRYTNLKLVGPGSSMFTIDKNKKLHFKK